MQILRCFTCTLIAILAGCGTSSYTPKIQYSYKGDVCPEIASNDKWETILDKPRWGDALTATILGESNISGYITGGKTSRSILYDWNGNPFTQTTNENGEIVKVVNDSTGCPIGQKEYAIRKIYFKRRADAPGCYGSCR